MTWLSFSTLFLPTFAPSPIPNYSTCPHVISSFQNCPFLIHWHSKWMDKENCIACGPGADENFVFRFASRVSSNCNIGFACFRPQFSQFRPLLVWMCILWIGKLSPTQEYPSGARSYPTLQLHSTVSPPLKQTKSKIIFTFFFFFFFRMRKLFNYFKRTRESFDVKSIFMSTKSARLSHLCQERK